MSIGKAQKSPLSVLALLNALLQVGYFGGFRRSEVVNLEVQHVAWEPEGIVITLPRSKTDKWILATS